MAPILAEDFDIISTAELRACGISVQVQQRLVTSGRLVRLARTVLSGARALRREGWWMAAQKAVLGVGCLTHETAGAIWRVDRIGMDADVPDDGVHVTVATRRSPAGWLTTHCSPSILQDRWVRIGRFVVSSLARTVVDLGEARTVQQLTNVLHEAWLVDHGVYDGVDAELRQRPNLPQIRTVQDALSLARAGDHGTINEFEDRWARIADEEGIVGLRFGFQISTPTLGWIVVDSAEPDAKIVIELDGGVHAAIRKRRRDRARDAELTRLGWLIVRLRWRDLREGRASSVARVKSLIARRTSNAPVPK